MLLVCNNLRYLTKEQSIRRRAESARKPTKLSVNGALIDDSDRQVSRLSGLVVPIVWQCPEANSPMADVGVVVRRLPGEALNVIRDGK